MILYRALCVNPQRSFYICVKLNSFAKVFCFTESELSLIHISEPTRPY